MNITFCLFFTFIGVIATVVAREKHIRVRRIVNGKDDFTDGWQFNAFINFRQPKSRWKVCGASLVAKNWVLTVASCLEDIIESPQHVTVGIGTKSLQYTPGNYNFTVSQIVTHPDYNLPHQRKKGKKFYIDNDIALMELFRPVPDDIKPITLADTDDDISAAKDTSCHATGWGAKKPIKNVMAYIRKTYDISDSLLEMGVKLISKEDCIKKQKIDTVKPNIYGEDRDLARIICGVAEEGEDQTTCLGDNGSPLVCKEGDRYILYGVILRSDYLCRPGKSAIFFAEVAKHREWIDQTIATE